MGSYKRPEKYLKFIIYSIIVILINIAGYSIFFRADLTENKVYSVSDATKNVIKNLSEPLTIKVFFTENLPAPHNNTKKYIEDLLKEYSINSNSNFNYKFYNIKTGEDQNEHSKMNVKLAESYGIKPIQLMVLEQDERKYQIAYMGLVIIHGDMIEKLPAITTTEHFEYNLTMAIKKLKNKTSALLALPEKIDVSLYYSSSLEQVAPYIDLKNISSLPGQIKDTIEKINSMNFDKINYSFHNMTEEKNLSEITKKYNIVSLKWPEIPQKNAAKIPAGSGGIGLVIKYQNNIDTVKILNSYRIPIIGTRYELTKGSELEEILNGKIESIIDINEKVGYISSNGTLSRTGGSNPMNPMMRQQTKLSSFNGLMAKGYSLNDIDLASEEIPDGINSLIVANPTKKLSDYELFKIDQALMSGKNIVFFVDPFKEVPPKRQQYGFNPGPSYQPVKNGLRKMLSSYGIKYDDAYVLDKKCYKQNLNQAMGGGERKIYFAPLIQNDGINHSLDFLKNIKGIITMRAAPLRLDTDKLEKNNIKSFKLFSTSKDSWLMKGRVNLNPQFITPPAGADKYKSETIAYMLEGEFTSYFAGKPIPEKPSKEEDKDKKPEKDLSVIAKKGDFISKGKKAKIFVIASAEMLKDTMLDAEGASPNAAFIMNTIDKLNNREDIAQMRSKEQKFNPLKEIDGSDKTAIKVANIAGLPAFVIFIGILIWVFRNGRKKRIQMMFQK